MKFILRIVPLVGGLAFCLAANPAPCVAQFTAVRPEPETTSEVVILHKAGAAPAFEWETLKKQVFPWYVNTPPAQMKRTVGFLEEALRKMTGRELPVGNSSDAAHGIVLALLEDCPDAIRADPVVVQALKSDGKDDYNNKEAFLIRTTAGGALLVARSVEGLNHAVVELLDSVGYEVLGMGANWTYVPEYHRRPLVFNLQKSDRPGYYIRGLTPTSGQQYGAGTLTEVPQATATADGPADESVEASYRRWVMGTRMMGQSMPGFPGHSLQGYHRAVLQRMRDSGESAGFLTPQTWLGVDSERPPATADTKGALWINTDAAGKPGRDQSFISDGTKWALQNPNWVNANLDLSVPLVRQVILDEVKKKTEASFKDNPDDLVVIGTDPEDGGGYAVLDTLSHDSNWYPEYLRKSGGVFGQPYVLNGFKGLKQPKEIWDGNSPADTVFGFNNWLLREFDRYIDALPAAERVTSAGLKKKDLLRLSLYSYNFHDVPPDFNIDPRIRVMIASYPKHRGYGKWINFASQTDMAQAFAVMLPREPSGDYWIISLAYYQDFSPAGIPTDLRNSKLPATLYATIQGHCKAGFRALNVETDFNHGRLGLEYYLYSKLMWNPRMTLDELTALRTRWIRRAYGSGWQEMKAYYDFMAPENFPVNAPNSWGKAIRFIEAADAKIDPAVEPDAQRRLDDLKQYWLYYYLLETGEGKPTSPAMREFVWKGQMSYMTAMHVPVRRIFGKDGGKGAALAAGDEFNKGPAHYTPQETAVWWNAILDHWRVTPVTNFADAKLANGAIGKSVDINDLVAVKEFGVEPANVAFVYNSGQQVGTKFLTVAGKAGEEIGFKLFWGWNQDDPYYRDRDVHYGISRWDAAKKQWISLVDESMVSVHSQPLVLNDGRKLQVVVVRFPAPAAGTYRFDLGRGGNAASLTTLDYDIATQTYAGCRGHTYFETLGAISQSPVFFYIPKGTKSLDFEVWDNTDRKTVRLNKTLPGVKTPVFRDVEVHTRGTHSIPLEPGEDGTVAMLSSNGFGFPFLYSVPMRWAKTPAALLVPRAIAQADGLTISSP